METRNRIIVLVEFSEYSENLVNFAFRISEIINAKVVLVHKITGITPAMADEGIRDEIIKSESEEAHSNLVKMAKGRVYSDDSFFVSQKTIMAILRDLKSDLYFDWVFTGLKEDAGKLKRLFMSSTTISIIDESDLLTVAVPAGIPVPVPTKLLVGVHPKYPLNKQQFERLLSALKEQIRELEFFTILKQGEDEAKINQYLSEVQEEYRVYDPVIRMYEGDDAFSLLKNRVEQTENSFLVLQQGSRSLSEQLFRKFMINELVYHAQTPLIVISR
ncbi:universal stress protein [Salinimicrobium sediminilitoris]|uniref:universal stress protein n=1 Tax=Salinimicrobium sediminilitoris TaxID=2876715 RepID=UPI001E349B5A|nr:universal stress protein [Salinimicrobium sediminilitoris]MCC8359059.1 universal stress protein [Salinimicrobium sediminilitoris]